MTSTMRFDRLENSTGTVGLDVINVPARAEVGVSPITPTSVSVSTGSATILSGGAVTFTAANDVNLAGVFTSAYKYYQVSFQYTGSAGSAFNLLGFFSSNGTSISSGYYGSSFYTNYGAGSGVDQARNNGANMLVGGGGQESEAHTDMQVIWKSGTAYQSMKYTNYSLSNAQNLWGGYSTYGVSDGLKISTGSARTITGRITVYGVR